MTSVLEIYIEEQCKYLFISLEVTGSEIMLHLYYDCLMNIVILLLTSFLSSGYCCCAT